MDTPLTENYLKSFYKRSVKSYLVAVSCNSKCRISYQSLSPVALGVLPLKSRPIGDLVFEHCLNSFSFLKPTYFQTRMLPRLGAGTAPAEYCKFFHCNLFLNFNKGDRGGGHNVLQTSSW